MLDKLTKTVLDVVNAQTGGAYKVLESEDFLGALPAGLSADEEGIAAALGYLSERGYVDMKYSDRGTYCVRSLPKGRTYAEAQAQSDEAPSAGRRRGGFFPAFLGALLGALAGGGIVAAVLAAVL